jgi:clan AA aspartic protease
MMTGVISSQREAKLSLTVRSSHGPDQAVQAVIDTGFDGDLTLPSSLIRALGLPYHSRTIATLADGSFVPLRIFRATVVWDGQDRTAYVLEADGGPLLGMGMLYGSRVTLDVVDGGDVRIEGLP